MEKKKGTQPFFKKQEKEVKTVDISKYVDRIVSKNYNVLKELSKH